MAFADRWSTTTVAWRFRLVCVTPWTYMLSGCSFVMGLSKCMMDGSCCRILTLPLADNADVNT